MPEFNSFDDREFHGEDWGGVGRAYAMAKIMFDQLRKDNPRAIMFPLPGMGPPGWVVRVPAVRPILVRVRQ